MSNERVKVKAVFLTTPKDDSIPVEVFAYFPEEVSDTAERYHISYAHEGQHSNCMELFALECDPAPLELYKPLLDELSNVIGYDVTVLDAKEWKKSNGKKLKVYKQRIQDIIADREDEEAEGEKEGAAA